MEIQRLIHKVRWSEDDSIVEGMVEFVGLTPDVECQLENNGLNYVYEERIREALVR